MPMEARTGNSIKKKKAAGPLVGNSTTAGQKEQRHGLVSKSFVLLAGKTMISRSQRARGLQGRRADRESESGKHEEVPSDSAEPGKKAAMPST